MTQGSNWGNHCEACGGLLEDHDVLRAAGSLLPIGPPAAAMIEFQRFDEPFRATAAGYALDPEFIEPPVAS